MRQRHAGRPTSSGSRQQHYEWLKDAKYSAAFAEKAPRGANRSAFLAAYVQCGNVTLAAQRAQVSRQQHYEWLRDRQYLAAFAKVRKKMEQLYVAGAQRRLDELEKDLAHHWGHRSDGFYDRE